MSRRLLAGLAAGVAVVALLAFALVSGLRGEASGGSGGTAAPVPAQRFPLAACPSAGVPMTAARPLPELVLPCLSAAGPATVALRNLTGTPTVINLWASWCGPCREELPAFQRLADRAGGRLRVLGVLTDDSADHGGSLLSAIHVDYASLFDLNRTLYGSVGARGLPVTIFVTATGEVVKVYNGAALTDASLAAMVRDTLGITTG